MFGRLQSTGTLLGSASKTAPPATSAKSRPHASVTAGSYSNSLASASESTSSRPRIPPCSLHHLVNATAESYISSSRPCTGPPLSVIVPTVIVSSVTPGAVAPLASPSWHTFSRSPKPPSSSEVVAPPPSLPPSSALVSPPSSSAALP